MTRFDHEILAEYSTRQSGTVGHEIVDGDGETVAWTVDPVLAMRIAKLLNDGDGHLECVSR